MQDMQAISANAPDRRGWLFSRRMLNGLGFLICAGGLGFAYYVQHYLGFEPCPLCIFQRLALLVDQLTPAGEKPADLLDDNTGVQAAVDQVNTGPYRGTATTAAYTIDELVFTAPDEAWFRYTITTDASVFADRFGKAVFNGEVWQITRDTICQDLALAEGICDPPAQPVVLPSDPEWEAAWREWWDRAMQYMPRDGCPPVSQC